LIEAFGKDVADVSLLQIFINLLRDHENDVRIAAIESLQKFIKLVSVDKLQIIIGYLKPLAKDYSAAVRCGVSDVIRILSEIVPKETAINNFQ